MNSPAPSHRATTSRRRCWCGAGATKRRRSAAGRRALKEGAGRKHSQSCKFYYHIQNFGKDATVDAFNRNQRLSAQVESLVSQILSGASDPWACVAWNAEDNQTILATHNVPEVQRGLCLNKSAVSIDREFGFRGPNPTLVAAAPGCDPCWCCQRPRFDIQLA
mmetsp:Transcript_94973/g.307225  ORF Transcript_94973/g.307225 Transcript_94973/m.307225 type:complete len:163 (+) Transcript_94973:2125-2613(+)